MTARQSRQSHLVQRILDEVDEHGVVLTVRNDGSSLCCSAYLEPPPYLRNKIARFAKEIVAEMKRHGLQQYICDEYRVPPNYLPSTKAMKAREKAIRTGIDMFMTLAAKTPPDLFSAKLASIPSSPEKQAMLTLIVRALAVPRPKGFTDLLWIAAVAMADQSGYPVGWPQ